jgi:hypothetical protein
VKRSRLQNKKWFVDDPNCTASVLPTLDFLMKLCKIFLISIVLL